MSSKIHHLQWTCLFLLLFIITSCASKQAVKKPEGKKEIHQETSRLENLSKEHPKTSVPSPSHLQLAYLYVNHRNPQLDYTRALQEMESHLSLSPGKVETDDFYNWLAVLRELDHVRKDWREMGGKNQGLQTQIEELRTSLENVQEANKNLQDEVANLKEMIEKLKTLDRQIEQKRNLIK